MLQVIVVALFAALLGAAFCFAGYRLFLVMLPIWGFFAGFWIGAESISHLFGTGFLVTTTAWVVGFFTGLFFAILSYLFYFFGVIILAGSFGAALGSGIMAAIGFDPGLLSGLVALVTALVMIILVLLFNLQKYVITAITAIGGANALVLSVLLLMSRVSLESLQGAGSAIKPVLQDSWFWLVIWLLIAVVGFAVQLRANRDFVFSKDRYVEGWG